MARLAKLDTKHLNAQVYAEFNEDDASLRVFLHAAQLAQFVGVMDEVDARDCLRQILVPGLASGIDIRRV